MDLSTAKGLETVKHPAPSTIGIDTTYKSRGMISEVFLRGCGVAEDKETVLHSRFFEGLFEYLGPSGSAQKGVSR